MTVLLFLAVPLTVVVALGAAILGGLVIRRSVLDRKRAGLLRLWPWALLSLAVALGLATAPVIAAERAEARTGWMDVDGDGMQDGLVNGSYDWLDVNGDAFAASWLIGITISGVVLGAGAWYLQRQRLARPLAP
jgi:hypothetical protein